MVEDEALLLCCTAGDLRDAGFDVVEAINADAAVRWLDANATIDILFTDIDMPGSMDGLALSALAARQHPEVKIFITSGKHRIADHHLPRRAVFLPKPYDLANLIAAFKTGLSQPS